MFYENVEQYFISPSSIHCRSQEVIRLQFLTLIDEIKTVTCHVEWLRWRAASVRGTIVRLNFSIFWLAREPHVPPRASFYPAPPPNALFFIIFIIHISQ